MKTVFFIALGGMIGAVLRYGAGIGFARVLSSDFPASTVIVNVLGSLIMGLVVGYGLYHGDISDASKAFLMVGVLGSFTTFSTFSLDFVNLIQKGNLLHAGVYMTSSVLCGVIALCAGIFFMRILTGGA